MPEPSSHAPGTGRRDSTRLLAFGLLAFVLVSFGVLQFKHLAYPLIWQDEGETVMFAQRILEHGYPKVHDGRNTVYGLGVPVAIGTKEGSDAYIGSLWGQYYFAALGVRWARGTPDLHRKTARLRLPFALAGSLGLVLIFFSIAPAFTVNRHGALWPGIGFALLACLSTSLILHLREVRYYALVVALLGLSLNLHHRGFGARPWGPWSRAVLQALCLTALFNVFYPAAVSLAVWFGVEAGWAAVRARGGGDPLRESVAIAVPVALATIVCLPLALYFEIFSLSALYSARYDFGWADYFANLRAALHYLARYEFLLLAIAIRIGVFVVARGGGLAPDGARPALQHSASLYRFCVVWVLLGARNPIFFERYFVSLSPIIGALSLLDSYALLQTLRERARFSMGSRVVLMVTAVTLAGSVAMKSPEWIGRAVEVIRVYRGPLDFVIPHLMRTEPDPASLRIATNYEAEAYMYYLGSRVVGRFHEATARASARDEAVEADIVIARRAQPRTLDRIHGYLEKGAFERVEFPVADLPYNNIPELFPGRVLPVTHFFETQEPDARFPPLSIRVRRESERVAPSIEEGAAGAKLD